MKSVWKYPTLMANIDAHDINQEVINDPNWQIRFCNENILMLQDEIRRIDDLLNDWRAERRKWERKVV